jgi:dipeptidyl aminopeptidase/acylaminoacyl peptidase
METHMKTNRRLNILSLGLVAACTGTTILGAPLEVVSRPYQTRPTSFGDSGDLSLSADGKWAVFTSTGNGLVTNQLDGSFLQVFLRNLQTGETTLLSQNTNGVTGNGHSYGVSISDDGGFVVFDTEADTIVSGDDNEASDVIIRRGVSGSPVSIRTSTGLPEGASGAASTSSNGRWVLFESEAQRFSPLDLNQNSDLYLLEVDTGAIQLVSANSNNTAAASASFAPIISSHEGSVSGDGRFVAFIGNGTNYVAGFPAQAGPQIYLRDMVNGTNAWLTRAVSGAPAAVVSGPVVSSNGSHVVFLSSNLEGTTVPGQFETALYIYNIATGSRSMVTTAPVEEFALSANSQFIAYSATNQVLVYDISAATNQLVSVNATGQPGDSLSHTPQISADGRYLAFSSAASNLATNVSGETFQTYRVDRQSGEIVLLSRGPDGSEANEDTHFPVISADGSTVGFMSYASNLATNDNPTANDVFVVAISGTGSVSLVSAAHPSSISATATGSSSIEGQNLSADGRRLVFTSLAADIVPDDENDLRDIFLRELDSGRTLLVSGDSTGAPTDGVSSLVGMSQDGGTVIFSRIEEVNGTNSTRLYSFNPSNGTNTVASVLPSGQVTGVASAVLSPDGRYAAFLESGATSPLYIRDLETAQTVGLIPAPITGMQPVAFSPSGRYIVTRSTGSSLAIRDWKTNGVLTNGLGSSQWIPTAFSADESKLLAQVRGVAPQLLVLYALGGTNYSIIATNAAFPAMSADGSTVLYNLPPVPTTNIYHLYIYDVASGVSSPLQLGGTNVNLRLRAAPALSADGRFIALATTNALTAEVDANDFTDVYVYDRVLKTAQLVSRNLEGEQGDVGSNSPNISADGRVVAFDSSASDLVENDRNAASDVFVARLEAVDTDTDGMEDGLETIYFGGLAGSPTADDDTDGISNRDELLAGTNPKSADSRFVLDSGVNGTEGTISLSSPATIGRVYQLQHRSSLSNGQWQDVGLPSVAYSNSITFEVPTDSPATGFFRIRAI